MNNLKETNIENGTCYYFHDLIQIEDFTPDIILIDEKSYENILVYKISYKSLIDSRPFRIRFDELDGFIRVYDGTKCLVLFGSEKDDFLYNRITYLIGIKSCITYVTSHNYAKIKIDSFYSSPLKNNDFHSVTHTLNQFEIKIKITTTIIYSQKKLTNFKD